MRGRAAKRLGGSTRAVERAGVKATFWDGSFAGFAAIIAGAKLYVGYDSAGQHVAAATGVPLISIFAGFPAPRMFERWRPTGPNCTVIRVDRPDVAETLARVKSAMGGQGGSRQISERIPSGRLLCRTYGFRTANRSSKRCGRRGPANRRSVGARFAAGIAGGYSRVACGFGRHESPAQATRARFPMPARHGAMKTTRNSSDSSTPARTSHPSHRFFNGRAAPSLPGSSGSGKCQTGKQHSCQTCRRLSKIQ